MMMYGSARSNPLPSHDAYSGWYPEASDWATESMLQPSRPACLFRM